MPAVARELFLTYGSLEVASVAVGGVYTLKATPTQPSGWIVIGAVIHIYGSAIGANNGVFTVTGVAGLVITTSNAASVVEGVSAARIGFPVAGVTDRILDSIVGFTGSSERAVLDFSFSIHKTTEAAFATEVRLVENAFAVPYQRFVLTQGAGTLASYDPLDTVNTGFNTKATVTKREDIEVNTGRSRRFFVSIEIGLPAGFFALAGIRNHRADVSFTPNDRKTITLTGECTALTTEGSARAQYAVAIALLQTTIIAQITGVYEKIDESVEQDETDKVVTFRRVLQQVRSPQSGAGAPDDPEVQAVEVVISGRKPAPGDTPTARRLREIQVRYTAWVDDGIEPSTKYTSSVRNWIITRALQRFGSAAGALVDETVETDEQDNRLIVNLTLLAQIDATARIQFTETLTRRTETGEALIPAWTGDPDSYYRFQGPRVRLRTQVSVERVLVSAGSGGGAPGGSVGGFFTFSGGQTFGGSQSAKALAASFGIPQSSAPGAAFEDPAGGAAGGGGGGGAGLVHVLLSEETEETPIRLGSPSHNLDVIDRKTTRVWQLIKPIAGGGGGPTVATGPTGGFRTGGGA